MKRINSESGAEATPEFTPEQRQYINKSRDVVLKMVAGYAAMSEKGNTKAIEELGAAIDADFAGHPEHAIMMFKILLSVAGDLLIRDYKNTHRDGE